MILPRSLMIVFLSIILIVGGGMLVLVRYLETNAIFFPGRDVLIDPSRFGLPYEDLYLTTSDNVTINAWFMKNPRATSTLIFAHGNAGTMSDRLLKAKFFYDLGLNVLLFDYRGYGKSHGHPTEKGVYLDAQAVYDHLKLRQDIDQGRIIAYGASLGGIVAVDLACHRPINLLIVDSSITSAREAAALFYPYIPSFLMRVKFDSIAKVARIDTPKIFMHSPDDRTIPYAMGRRLFEVALEPKEFIVTSGGHNEIQILNDHKAADTLKRLLIARGLL